MDNQATLAHLVKMGGTGNLTYDSGGKGNIRILFSQSDQTYCRIPGQTRLPGKLKIRQANGY